MKSLLMLVSLLVSVSVFAESAPSPKAGVKSARKIASEEVKCSENPNEGIGIDPEYIEQQVKKAGSCWQATMIVESCGAGSSLDNSTTSAAITFCDAKTGKLSAGDKKLKKMMLDRCEKTCNPRTDGTLCQSQQAFCRMSVSRFINSVNEVNN